jgi:hypothetical protein
VTLEREISLNQVGYLRAFFHRTEYKESNFGGYDYAGYFLGYEVLGARSSLTAEVGVEELRDQGETEDGLYVDFYFDRALGTRSSATLTYIRRYADSGDIFALNQDLEPILGGTSNVLVSGEPVWLQLGSLIFRWYGSRTSADLIGFWSDEDVDSAVQPDREMFGVGLSATRWFTESARLGASVYVTREEWSGPLTQELNDVAAMLEFEVQLSPKLSLLTSLESFSRDDSPANYDENRIMLLLRYTPKAVGAGLPTYYARRMGRRFAVGGEAGPQEDHASGSRDRP